MNLKKLIELLKKYIYKTYLLFIWYLILFYHYLEKSQLRIHKNIITISKSSKRDIIRHYKVNEEKIKIIPNGVDLDKFNPKNYSKAVREKYGNKILLYSGLMVERKNIPVLLKAFRHVIKELPDVRLILTGKGPYLDDYKELSKSLNIQKKAYFLGFVSDKELLKLLATSDIFVFPSELEGFGQVIMESFASGTPVICSDIPPMADIIEDAGKTFKPGDPKDLAMKIIELFEDNKLHQGLVKKTVKVAEKYKWSNIAREYQNYIKNVIKSKQDKNN